MIIIGEDRERGGAADYPGPVPTNQRVESALGHNMERPVQYEYSNEPEDEDEDTETGEAAEAERNYVNELILQRSRNRHPAITDETHRRRPPSSDDGKSTTLSTLPTSSV